MNGLVLSTLNFGKGNMMEKYEGKRYYRISLYQDSKRVYIQNDWVNHKKTRHKLYNKLEYDKLHKI